MENRTYESVAKYKNIFPQAHSFIVSLHAVSLAHALENAEIAFTNGAHGAAVVTHVISPSQGIAIANTLKEKFPHHKILLNILQWAPHEVFENIKDINVHGIWTDRAKIFANDTMNTAHIGYADFVRELQEKNNWTGLYLGNVNFKHQLQLSDEQLPVGIEQASRYLDVLTTSGKATGSSADVEQVKKIKTFAGKHPVALASGIGPANIKTYLPYMNLSIVATDISVDREGWDLDPSRVYELGNIIRLYNIKSASKEREQKMVEKYEVSSVKELYDAFKQQGVINISGNETDFLERNLSNLTRTPFVLDGVEYASVESFWMSLKYPEDHDDREFIIKQSGIIAKRLGDDARFTKVVYYGGKQIPIGSDEHHALLKRALQAKLESHPDIKKALLVTGNRPIEHCPFYESGNRLHSESLTLPSEKLAQLYTQLREELREKK